MEESIRILYLKTVGKQRQWRSFIIHFTGEKAQKPNGGGISISVLLTLHHWINDAMIDQHDYESRSVILGIRGTVH